MLYWDPPTTTNNHQQSLTQFNRSLRLTTYDFLAFYWDPPPLAVSHSVQSLSAASQPTLTAISELRLTTYDWTQLCFTGWDPPTSKQSLTQFNLSQQPASQPAIAYHTSEQSTLQTPDSHTTLANTYQYLPLLTSLKHIFQSRH